MTSITRPQFSATNRPTGYYTYAYLRENGTPWYIGKGTARRAWDRHGNPNTKKTWRAPSNDRILILKWDLTEAAAHRHEMYLIGIYGNAFTDGGLLTRNFTDGGEGCSGRVTSEETKAKISAANAGKDRPQELRERISRSLTGRVQPRELVERRKASRQGYRHAVETVARISATNSATKLASDASATKAAEVGVPHDVWQTMPKQARKHAAKYKARAEAFGYTLTEWMGMTRGERCSASKRRYFQQQAA
jgi:hypothetical protein